MSVWYSPKLNGVAERTIRVLTNVVCAMLHDSGLPKSLWAEAFNAATTDNKTPTKALGGRTPFEVLYGAKSDVSHLRAFSTPRAIVEPTERLSMTIGRRCVSSWGTSTRKAATGFGFQKGELSSSPDI